jgi:hypothetical protein
MRSLSIVTALIAATAVAVPTSRATSSDSITLINSEPPEILECFGCALYYRKCLEVSDIKNQIIVIFILINVLDTSWC